MKLNSAAPSAPLSDGKPSGYEEIGKFFAVQKKWMHFDPLHVPCAISAVFCVTLLLWIAFHIGYESFPAIQKHGFSTILDSDWNPNVERYGIFSFLMGTLASSLISMLFALPLGLMIAIFLSENFLPPVVRRAFGFMVDLLAAIPSVVYGLWGIAVVIPFVQEYGTLISGWVGDKIPFFAGPVYGNSMLTASLVLALMILPTITSISRNALESVPLTLREGGYCLGATRWETIMGVILPTALPGVAASAVLAMGRAMGETMAVAMLIGNSSRFSWSMLSPGGTLAGLLANQFAEAQGMVISVLMFVAMILLVMTLIVNIIGEWILKISMSRVREF